MCRIDIYIYIYIYIRYNSLTHEELMQFKNIYGPKYTNTNILGGQMC